MNYVMVYGFGYGYVMMWKRSTRKKEETHTHQKAELFTATNYALFMLPHRTRTPRTHSS